MQLDVALCPSAHMQHGLCAAGDAHIILNAGGRVTEDTIRSLVISQRFLGVKEVYVVHHTKCGLMLFGARSYPRTSSPPPADVKAARNALGQFAVAPSARAIMNRIVVCYIYPAQACMRIRGSSHSQMPLQCAEPRASSH